MSSSGTKSAVGTVVAMGVVGGGAIWLAQALAIVALGAVFVIGLAIVAAGGFIFYIGKSIFDGSGSAFVALIGAPICAFASYLLIKTAFGESLIKYIETARGFPAVLFVIGHYGGMLAGFCAFCMLIDVAQSNDSSKAAIAMFLAFWAGFPAAVILSYPG